MMIKMLLNLCETLNVPDYLIIVSSLATILKGCLLPPCRAQRRSLAGWRTWWRCTRPESETWRFSPAWTCTVEQPGATPKSSRSRPTCTPTRVRSDIRRPPRQHWCCSFLFFSTVVDGCGTKKRCCHLRHTDLQQVFLWMLCAALPCGPFTGNLLSSHSSHPSVKSQHWTPLNYQLWLVHFLLAGR